MSKNIKPFKDKNIEEIFNSYPKNIKNKLLLIRGLIFSVASGSKTISTVEETLKWGEPSYVCKTGSTVRIDKIKGSSTEFAVFFNCKTSLISTFKEIFGNQFKYSGNRAIVFNTLEKINEDNLKHCIYLSLTYFQK